MNVKRYLCTSIKTYDYGTRKITFENPPIDKLSKRTLYFSNKNDLYYVENQILKPLINGHINHPTPDGTDVYVSYLTSDFHQTHNLSSINIKGFLTIDTYVKADVVRIHKKSMLVCGRKLDDNIYSNSCSIEVTEIASDDSSSCFLFGAMIKCKNATLKNSQLYGCKFEGGKIFFDDCYLENCTFINCDVIFVKDIKANNNTFYGCTTVHDQYLISHNQSYYNSEVRANDTMIFIDTKSSLPKINVPFTSSFEHTDTFIDEFQNPISGAEVRYIEYPFIGKKLESNMISVDINLVHIFRWVLWEYICIDKYIYSVVNVMQDHNEVLIAVCEELPHTPNITFSRVVKRVTDSDGISKALLISKFCGNSIVYEPKFIVRECKYKDTISRSLISTENDKNVVTVDTNDLHSTFDFMMKEKLSLQDRLSRANREKSDCCYELRKMKNKYRDLKKSINEDTNE